MTVPVVLAIAGVIILLVGVLGGGIKAKEIEIPTVPTIGRILMSICGLILIAISIWLSGVVIQEDVPEMPTAVPSIEATFQPGETQESGVVTETTNTVVPDPTKKYMIQSVRSGKVLSVSGGSTENGTPIVQYEWTGEVYQIWRFESLEGADTGYYSIYSEKSGKCIDVKGSAVEDNEEILQYTCYKSDNQKWHLLVTQYGTVIFEVKHSKKVLDILGGSRENGVSVIQFELHGGENQQWIIHEVEP